MKPSKQKLDVWPATVWAATSAKQLRSVSKAMGLPGDLEADHAGRTFSVTGPDGLHLVIYVDLAGHGTHLSLVNTLAHEASHAADGLFEYVEEDRPGAEARAYLTGWFTEFLLAHCERHNKE